MSEKKHNGVLCEDAIFDEDKPDVTGLNLVMNAGKNYRC